MILLNTAGEILLQKRCNACQNYVACSLPECSRPEVKLSIVIRIVFVRIVKAVSVNEATVFETTFRQDVDS